MKRNTQLKFDSELVEWWPIAYTQIEFGSDLTELKLTAYKNSLQKDIFWRLQSTLIFYYEITTNSYTLPFHLIVK